MASKKEILSDLQAAFYQARESGNKALEAKIVQNIQNVMNSDKSTPIRASLAEPPLSVSTNRDDPTSKNRGPHLWANESEYWANLQKEFGDKDTYKEKKKTSGKRTIKDWYDKDKLATRAARFATYYNNYWGRTQEDHDRKLKAIKDDSKWPEINPASELGFHYMRMKAGAKQFWRDLWGEGDPNHPDEVASRERELMYQAGNPSALDKLGAFGIEAGTSMLTAPITAVGIGALAGKKALEKYGLRKGFEHIGRGNPGLFFGSTAAAGGAIYPVDPYADETTRWMHRGLNSAAGFGFGYLGSNIGNLLADAGAASFSDAARRKLFPAFNQRNKDAIPGTRPPKLPITTLQGNLAGKEILEEAMASKGPAKTRAMQLDRQLRNDQVANFNALVESTTGQTDLPEIGTHMEKILDVFFDRFKQSKARMDAAYAATKGDIDVITNKKDFAVYLKGLEDQIKRENLRDTGPIADILKELRGLVRPGKTKRGRGMHRSISLNDLKMIDKKLSKAYARVNNSEEYKDLVPTVNVIRNSLDNYMDNALLRAAGSAPSTGKPGALQEELINWRKAKAMARSHYDRYTGNKYIDEYVNTRLKMHDGEKPAASDVSNHIFLGGASAFDLAAQPRREAIRLLRKGTGGTNIDNHLRGEALSTLRGPKNPLDPRGKIINGIETHMLPGTYSEVYDEVFKPVEKKALEHLWVTDKLSKDPLKGIDSINPESIQMQDGVINRTVSDWQTPGAVRDSFLQSLGLNTPIIKDFQSRRMLDRMARRIQADVPGNFGPRVRFAAPFNYAAQNREDMLSGVDSIYSLLGQENSGYSADMGDKQGVFPLFMSTDPQYQNMRNKKTMQDIDLIKQLLQGKD